MMNSDTLIDYGAVQNGEISNRSERSSSNKLIVFLSFVTSFFFYSAIGMMLYLGWDNRNSHHLTMRWEF